jgi:Na+/alanine symporter
MDFSFFLPLLVGGAGLFMLIKLRFFFIVHPSRCCREFLRELRSPRSRRALCLALAGTLGVGNIFGVAAGIMIGGAGSVFWLLLSSVFSMVLKYSEAALATDIKKDRGGMQCVVEAAFPRVGKPLAKTYSLFCLILALFMGAAMQSAACTDTLKASAGLFSGASAVVISLLVAVSVVRVILSSLLFGNFAMMIYSLSGAALALVFMILTKRSRVFSAIGVSVTGGVMHNAGQVIAASVMMENAGIAAYVIPLIISGTLAGVAVGVISALLVGRLEGYLKIK